MSLTMSEHEDVFTEGEGVKSGTKDTKKKHSWLNAEGCSSRCNEFSDSDNEWTALVDEMISAPNEVQQQVANELQLVSISTDGNCQKALIRQIRAAKESVDLAVHSFLDLAISSELQTKVNQGVRVRILVDTNEHEQNMAKYKCTLHSLHGSDVWFNLMSNCSRQVKVCSCLPVVFMSKYLIVDKKTVGMGSYNFSGSTTKATDQEWIVVRIQKQAERLAVLFDKKWKKSRAEVQARSAEV